MTLGPFLFGAPLALIGLLALPVIWLILRSTPPAPRLAELPSLILLDGIASREETPARTPWWVLVIRMLAAALACIGLSLPVYAPGVSSTDAPTGPVLIVIDNGWTSAPRWDELMETAGAALDGTPRDTAAHLLLTAPTPLSADPAERLSRQQFEARLRSLQPVPWAPDPARALGRLQATGLQPGRIVWLSDGLSRPDLNRFARDLSALAPLSIFAAPPRGAAAITGLESRPGGVSLQIRRAEAVGAAGFFVSALTANQSALATAEARFEPGSLSTIAAFDIPPAALSRITSFRVTGTNSAGTVWLWDSNNRARRVGLVSGDKIAQPLLSDIHYVRKALAPFSTIQEGSLTDLVEDNPDAIVLTDIGQIPAAQKAALTDWIERGGALIRFAGPRLAAQADDLLPTPLRRASRAIGGALTWEDPQPLGPFPDASPFAGLVPPENVTIQQQVLARPGPDLAQRTWSQLADGSPLVTAQRRGQGMLILFHVTAGPDWSSLPYSGLFVDMLQRSISAGRGETFPDDTGLYTPVLSLDGRGRLGPALASSVPLKAPDFATVIPSSQHPPGLYQGPAGSRAVNIGRDAELTVTTSWPEAAVLLGDAAPATADLAGLLLALVLGLILLDIGVSLKLANRLPFLGGTTTRSLVLLVSVSLVLLDVPVHAQGSEIALGKEAEAALKMRLAYIETGDPRTDDTLRAGLQGLSAVLYRRSSVEPALPHAVNPETDALDVYPILFVGMPDNPLPLSDTAINRLNTYMRAGGALFIDTRDGREVGQPGLQFERLAELMPGLDTPALIRVPRDHVLTRSFYLLDGFSGRFGDRPLWIEATGARNPADRRGDGVSRLFVGDADYVSAWAVDERGRPLYSVDGGNQERELSYRFGVNLVIYVLTGNYKEDQVHLPALLERLGDNRGTDPVPDLGGGVIP